MRSAHILILSKCSVCPANHKTRKVVTHIDANGDVDKMDKCPKCGVPAMQVVDGECIECRLFQVHRDPEPVTYADKLKVMVSQAGTESFFSLMPRLWSGRIAVRDLPHPTGKAVKYMFFDRGNLETLSMTIPDNAMINTNLSLLDMSDDTWHLLPEDMEFSSPVDDREMRAIRLMNRMKNPEFMRFFAHCEHAETWMQQ